MGAIGVIAHEYGHALQWMSGLVDLDTPGLVREQQADCFAGVYLRSVAAGHSKRFTLSTADGLNRVLAGVIYLRDRLVGGSADDPHGSALDRVSAFQMGFTGGADQCATIDDEEITFRATFRRTSRPRTTPDAGQPIIDDRLSQLMRC